MKKNLFEVKPRRISTWKNYVYRILRGATYPHAHLSKVGVKNQFRFLLLNLFFTAELKLKHLIKLAFKRHVFSCNLCFVWYSRKMPLLNFYLLFLLSKHYSISNKNLATFLSWDPILFLSVNFIWFEVKFIFTSSGTENHAENLLVVSSPKL